MRTNARTTKMLILMARGEFNTFAAITTPCSVKARGMFRRPPCPELEVAICDFKFSYSACFNRKTKSDGNRAAFLFTCSFRRRTETPYKAAKSASRIILWLRRIRILNRLFWQEQSRCWPFELKLEVAICDLKFTRATMIQVRDVRQKRKGAGVCSHFLKWESR